MTIDEMKETAKKCGVKVECFIKMASHNNYAIRVYEVLVPSEIIISDNVSERSCLTYVYNESKNIASLCTIKPYLSESMTLNHAYYFTNYPIYKTKKLNYDECKVFDIPNILGKSHSINCFIYDNLDNIPKDWFKEYLINVVKYVKIIENMERKSKIERMFNDWRERHL